MGVGVRTGLGAPLLGALDDFPSRTERELRPMGARKAGGPLRWQGGVPMVPMSLAGLHALVTLQLRTHPACRGGCQSSCRVAPHLDLPPPSLHSHARPAQLGTPLDAAGCLLRAPLPVASSGAPAPLPAQGGSLPPRDGEDTLWVLTGRELRDELRREQSRAPRRLWGAVLFV